MSTELYSHNDEDYHGSVDEAVEIAVEIYLDLNEEDEPTFPVELTIYEADFADDSAHQYAPKLAEYLLEQHYEETFGHSSWEIPEEVAKQMQSDFEAWLTAYCSERDLHPRTQSMVGKSRPFQVNVHNADGDYEIKEGE
jgi:hypothetical protein